MSPAAGGLTRGGVVSKLVLANTRCFERAEVPLDAQVTVIIGQNGAGKTTIAEAIASLAPGEREGLAAFPLRSGATSGSIVLHGDGGRPLASWTEKGASSRRKRLAEGLPVLVYGQYRALRPPARVRSPGVSLDIFGTLADEPPMPEDLRDAIRRPATRTLFDFDEYLFRDLSAYVALLERQGAHDAAARRTWERLCAWLAHLDGARIEGVEIVEREGGRTAAFRRAGVVLPLAELSDGYRAMLSVVLDLVIRFSQGAGPAGDPLAERAVVVIDEVDLNLHPRWQRRVVDQLTTLFPATQFVLTTHSPAIVQAAIDDQAAIEGKEQRAKVLVLDEDRGKGVTVRPLGKADLRRLDGAEVDSVMVDDRVFGVDSRYSPTYERLELEAAALAQKLEEGLATAAERKRLLALLDELQGLVAREEEREEKGPLMSAIARTQIGLLKLLDGQVAGKGDKRRDPAPKKRR